MTNKNDILISSTERRYFYVKQSGNLAVERLNRFSVDPVRLPVLLEGEMYNREEYRKKWRQENKAYFKKWAEDNKEKICAASRKWKRKNEAYCYKKTREWFSKHPWASNHSAAKNRCTNSNSFQYTNYGGRGIKFNLTMAETVMLWDRDKASQMKSPSIHRKDNDGNYEYSNCEFIEMSDHSRKTWTGRHHSEKSKKLMSIAKKNRRIK